MNFKNWIINEIVELKKPNNVRKNNIVKNKGTNTAYQVIQYQFKTKLGNIVKVHFQPKDDDEYVVSFYVNDTMDDNASGVERDPDILPTAFYTIKEKANKLNAKVIRFDAIESKNDTKTIKNLNTKEYQSKFIIDLNNFKQQINNYKPILIYPNQELYNKLKRPLPPPRYDLDTNYWNDIIKFIYNQLDNIIELRKFKDLLEQNLIKNINVTNILESLQNLINANLSNTETGWQRKINRRENIYNKIVNKYFSSEWDISKNKNHFVLTRI